MIIIFKIQPFIIITIELSLLFILPLEYTNQFCCNSSSISFSLFIFFQNSIMLLRDLRKKV